MTSTTPRQTTRGDYIAGLRALAEALDTKQQLPVPWEISLCLGITGGDDGVWRDLAGAASILHTSINERDGVLMAVAKFGPLSFRLIACTQENARAAHGHHGAAS